MRRREERTRRGRKTGLGKNDKRERKKRREKRVKEGEG